MNIGRTMVMFGAACALAAIQVPAFAHGSMKPQHGGQVQMSGETVLELVTTPKGVDIYVSEEDEPVAASGYSAKLTITTNGQKQEVPLKALAGNRLTAAGVKLAAGAKLIVALVAKADGSRVFATFTAK